MRNDQSGPAGIVNQLELEFDEITPLSREQRIACWLATQSYLVEDMTTATAALFLEDGQSRRNRAERLIEVQTLQAPFESSHGWLTAGGAEVVLLYNEACNAYISGLFLSTLLGCHAACERALAGCFAISNEEVDKKWMMWGLGKLTPAAFEKGLIDRCMKDRLELITELRKVSAHYKPLLTPNAIQIRAIEFANANKILSEELALEGLLKSDALLALQVATELLRGDQGFARVRFLRE